MRRAYLLSARDIPAENENAQKGILSVFAAEKIHSAIHLSLCKIYVRGGLKKPFVPVMAS
jgi:hypothetical protein